MSEWLDEPSREEFEHAGYRCLILRNPELGCLCGYTGVQKGHPCYGKGYEYIPYDDLLPVEVHGGLTFSSVGDGEKWPTGYWWLGFDCAHAWDLVPYMQELIAPLEPYMQELTAPLGHRVIYKNFQYVRQETKKLADQVAMLEFIDWEFCWVWPLLLPVRAVRGIWNGKYRNRNR